MSTFIMTGRLGRPAELRTTSAGTKVLSFSLADDRWNGKEKQTLWVNCALWGERGEKLAQYLTKGTVIEVTGEVSARYFESKGEHRASLELFVRDLKLHGGGSKDDAPVADKSRNTNPDLDDELPPW